MDLNYNLDNLLAELSREQTTIIQSIKNNSEDKGLAKQLSIINALISNIIKLKTLRQKLSNL
jgi:hypothetical protein